MRKLSAVVWISNATDLVGLMHSNICMVMRLFIIEPFFNVTFPPNMAFFNVCMVFL